MESKEGSLRAPSPASGGGGVSSPPSPGEPCHGLRKDDFYSDSRQTTMGPAVFALVNTVVGGGVLSLPYSFQLAGSLLGAVILACSCVGTGFTLFCLISASRRTGARTFEGVMKAAFGTWAQVLVVVLVFIITFLTPVAYLILLRELISPIIEAYVLSDGASLPRLSQDVITAVLAVVVTPLTSLSSMGAIGSLAAFSMLSILILAATVVFRSASCMMDAHEVAHLPLVNTSHPADILSSVPVFVCCFLCHFNVLGVFSELEEPTRGRSHALVHWTMCSTGLLYLVVGLAGYGYGVCRSGSVRDNVLSSFPSDDALVTVARAALVVVLCFCYPLLLIPCRDSATRLYQIVRPAASSSRRRIVNGVIVNNSRGRWGDEEGQWALQEQRLSLLSQDERLASQTADAGASAAPSAATRRRQLLVSYVLTGLVILIACSVDSVSVMWAIMGSFACIAVAFIFPPAAYLKVGCRKQRVKRCFAALTLGLGCVLGVLCVAQTVRSLVS